MKDYKFLDRVGVAYLWKRMTQYVNSIIPKKLSQLENDRGYTSNGVTSVNGSNGDVTLEIPTKTSQLQNDSHFITEDDIPTSTDVYTKNEVNSLLNGKQNTINDLSTIRSGAAAGATALQGETDPTVPSWAKASTKPSYSVNEISGAQAALVSGINIKTINGDSVLGGGNITIEGGGSGDENIIETVKVNNVALTPDANKAVNIDLSGYAQTSDIPSEVTESTVSGWGFTKNTGTYSKPNDGIPSTDLASAVQTSLGKADTALQSFTETDPVFAASAAAGITSTDISNWNDKVSKSSTAGLIKNDGTIDTSTYLTSVHEVPAGGNSGQVLKKSSATDYDYAWANQTQDYPSAYCKTAAGTAGKTAACTLWTATANTYLHLLIVYANTSASALTLNINSTTAKPIYINGTASSSTNYTLPAGSYIVFYDGTNYHFRTDGRIAGPSSSVLALSSEVSSITFRQW